MIDESNEFGARVARHLREETVAWLTTVTPSGAPLPRPVGFLWDGGEDLSVYSQPGARIRNIVRNPKVTLNFRGDADGGDIVVLSGMAEVDESGPSAAEDAGWAAEYAPGWKRVGDDGRVFRAALQRVCADSHQGPSTGSERCPRLSPGGSVHVPVRETRRTAALCSVAFRALRE